MKGTSRQPARSCDVGVCWCWWWVGRQFVCWCVSDSKDKLVHEQRINGCFTHYLRGVQYQSFAHRACAGGLSAAAHSRLHIQILCCLTCSSRSLAYAFLFFCHVTLLLTSSRSFFSQAVMRTRGSLSSSCRRCSMAWTTCFVVAWPRGSNMHACVGVENTNGFTGYCCSRCCGSVCALPQTPHTATSLPC